MARHWKIYAMGATLALLAWFYLSYPDAARFLMLFVGAFAVLMSLISGAVNISQAREDTRIYSLYSENYRARHRIPGEPMRLHQLDIEEMTPEELEEARARGWVTTPDETEDEDGLGWEVEYYRKK